MRSLFYARYFTMASLVAEVFKGQSAHADVLAKLDMCPPNELFKKCADKVMEDARALSEADLVKQKSYGKAVRLHFDDDDDLAHRYLQLEEFLLRAMKYELTDAEMATLAKPFATTMRLRELFSSFNRQTLPYVARSLSKDYRRLSKAKDRLKEFFMRNQIFLSSLGTLLGIFLATITLSNVLAKWRDEFRELVTKAPRVQ